MLLPTHSIWLMLKIPSKWENSVICSFKCELKNSQSYLLLAIKGENKTGLAWFWWLIIDLSLWRPGLNLTAVQVGFVTKWHRDRVLQFVTINVILPLFHTHISFICLCTMSNWKHCYIQQCPVLLWKWDVPQISYKVSQSNVHCADAQMKTKNFTTLHSRHCFIHLW